MFSFLWRKAAFAVVPLILAGLLFASCEQPPGTLPIVSDPVYVAPPIITKSVAQPSITTQPAETTPWDVGSTTSIDLKVVATSPDGGTLSYQWYSNSSASNTDGSILTEKTASTLTLDKTNYTANNSYYFYVVVTNTNNSVNGTKTASITSSVATVTVTGNTVPTVNAQQPNITTQPAANSWNVSTTNSINLTVAATSPDSGTLSYQWYRNTSNSTTGGTAVGTNSATLTLNKADYTTNTTYYFYVVVTNTNNSVNGTKTATSISSIATVTVTGNSVPIVNAQQPGITANPSSSTWNVVNSASLNLTVTASVTDGGTLSYQWYRNTSNSTTGGTAVGTNSSTLTLDRTDTNYRTNGARYFYVMVTNTNNNATNTKTATATSSVATVTISGYLGTPIYTQADMAGIGGATGTRAATYHLMQNITLADFSPVGNSTTPFTGTFLGDGKTITLNSFSSTAVSGNTHLGIFGYVKGTSTSAKAVIKNLTVYSAINTTYSSPASSQLIGLVTGYAENAELDTITLSGTFKLQSTMSGFGGVAGTITQAGTVVKNCKSSLTIDINHSGGDVGGFVGRFTSGAGIESCQNSGNITVVGTGQTYVGGIATGSNYGFSTAFNGYIQDCSYTGNISGQGAGNWTWVGGIAAVICGGTVNDNNASTRIVRCFVTGTVTLPATNSNAPYIGGIVAYSYYGALVSQCYFTGQVFNKKGGPCGGIVGYNSQNAAPNNSRVEDCWSSGLVSGYNDAGGIVGESQVNTYVRRCYSTAAVETIYSSGSGSGTNGGGVGGIVGQLASTNTDACTACVALNPSIKSPQGNFINRVTGSTAGTRSNNYALSTMTINAGTGTYTEAKGLTERGGEDIPSGSLSGGKPIQTFYQTTLGWNFSTVWKWNSSTGYPVLQWQ